jgi:hypothetical protein
VEGPPELAYKAFDSAFQNADAFQLHRPDYARKEHRTTAARLDENDIEIRADDLDR